MLLHQCAGCPLQNVKMFFRQKHFGEVGHKQNKNDRGLCTYNQKAFFMSEVQLIQIMQNAELGEKYRSASSQEMHSNILVLLWRKFWWWWNPCLKAGFSCQKKFLFSFWPLLVQPHLAMATLENNPFSAGTFQMWWAVKKLHM